jgi:Big-like domain-containing protein
MAPRRRIDQLILSLNGVRFILAGIVLATFEPASVAALPQTEPVIQIKEPAPGSVVNPGQTLTVKVISPTPALFAELALMGEAPIGFAGTISQLPGEFLVSIPKDIDLGSHRLTVEGTPRSGREPIFAAVEIDVERSDVPISMSAMLSGINLDSPGEQIPLEVLVHYLDGSTYPATSSSRVSFSSANTEVATVDASGQVTAVAPGIGLITVKYTQGDNKLSIGVPVQVPNHAPEPGVSNFFILIAPGMQTIEPGSSASFKVTVSTYTGFAGEIALSAHGLPEGAKASFAPVSVLASESATLTISTLRSTPLDTYPIFITGRSGKLNPTVSVLITVTADGKR